MIVWQMSAKLRGRIYQIAKKFSRSEYRRVAQMNDAARSVKQNIQEGYCQKSLGKYIQYLSGNAKPSLGELEGDVDDCFEDGLITEEEYKELKELINKTNYLFKRLIESLERLREKRKSENP